MLLAMNKFLFAILLILTQHLNAQVPTDSLIGQPVTEKPRRSDYNKVLADALRLQLKADSAARITRDLRILARETPDDSIKKQLDADILKTDKQAKSFQREADKKYTEARKVKEEISVDTSASPVTLSREINGIKVYQYRMASGNNIESPDDSAGSGINNTFSNVDEPEKIESSSKMQAISLKTDNFSIADHSPYSDINPIPRELSQDTGLVYRIQLGVFSKIRPNDAFGGINPIAYEQVKGSSMLKYYAGLFYSINSVTKALETIRWLGFPDAFIVAFHNGMLISTEKAREIEFAGFRL
jgi:hypothetical protein